MKIVISHENNTIIFDTDDIEFSSINKSHTLIHIYMKSGNDLTISGPLAAEIHQHRLREGEVKDVLSLDPHQFSWG